VKYNDDFDDDFHSGVVGGDGWSGHDRRRQRQQRQLSSLDLQNLKRLHRSNNAEPEKLTKGGNIHQYWTVTGRNLVNEVNELATAESLLVDASSLRDTRDMNYDNATWAEKKYNDSLKEGEDPFYNGQVTVDGTTEDLVASQVQSELSSTEEGEAPSQYQPIRLRAILTDDETSGSKYLTSLQRKILMEDMINPALYAWSQALHVVPVGGEGNDNLVIDGSQLYDGLSCGPGLVRFLIVVICCSMSILIKLTERLLVLGLWPTQCQSSTRTLDRRLGRYRHSYLRQHFVY
jgi:hypothetical protein